MAGWYEAVLHCLRSFLVMSRGSAEPHRGQRGPFINFSLAVLTEFKIHKQRQTLQRRKCRERR